MIDFNKMVSNYIEKENKPKTVGRYYPSEIGGCLRKVWFSYKQPKEPEPDLLKIFEIGNMMHEFVVDVLQSEKNGDIDLVDAELPFEIKMKDFTVSGRIDNLIIIKAANKNVLVEVKSVGDLSKINCAKEQHQMQLQLYMFAMKVRDGLLLYVDKKNLRSKTFTVEYDEPQALHALERFSILHNYLKEDIIPEAEAKLDNCKRWTCFYCEYKEECNKADGFNG